LNLKRRVAQSEESATARIEGEEDRQPIFGDGEPGLYHQVKLQEEEQNKYWNDLQNGGSEG
jgi:hypothetical protein